MRGGEEKHLQEFVQNSDRNKMLMYPNRREVMPYTLGAALRPVNSPAVPVNLCVV
jgi:hypothetical protein